MRARPKILLAETYEDGMELFECYERNVLGIISDVRFPKNGVIDGAAGFTLCSTIRRKNPDMPFLLLSAEGGNEVHNRVEQLVKEIG